MSPDQLGGLLSRQRLGNQMWLNPSILALQLKFGVKVLQRDRNAQ